MKTGNNSSVLIRLILVLVFVFPLLIGCGGGGGGTPAPAGQVLHITVHSTLLDKNMRVNVYLPPGYETGQQYPVLYLMHGYLSNEASWMPESLQINRHADQLIAANRIRPLIMVATEMDNSWGLNSATNNGKVTILGNPFDTGMYEDYVIKELIPYIDAHYSTISTRDGRYIGGISMGGFIALHDAFVYPDIFSKVGGHSPAIYMDAGTDAASKAFLQFLYPDATLRQARDPFKLAETKDLSMMKVYLDAGTSDYGCHIGGDNLNKLLQSRGVTSEFHDSPGGHEGTYWSSHLDEYLRFYAGI